MDNNKDDSVGAQYASRYPASQSQAAQPTGLEGENELIGMATMKTIRSAIRVQDGMDGDDWDFALANAVAAHIAGTSQATKAQAADPQQVEWSRDLQSRLIAVGKDQDHDVQNIMAEAACLLAAFTNNALAAPVAKEATRDAEPTEKAKPIAAAVRAAERVDAMHKGVVGVFAAIKAEHLAQANVLPPFAAPAGQQDARDPNWLLSTMDGKDWADEFCRLNNAADHGMMLAWFCNAIMTGYDTGRRHEADEQSNTAVSAKGGITNTESGSDIATTTSTVSAPASDSAAVDCVECGGSGEMFGGFCCDECLGQGKIIVSRKDLAEGAQKAPEEVRDAARLDAFAKNPSWELSQDSDPEEAGWCVHKVVGPRNDREWREIGKGSTPRAAIDAALRTSSTDQANADTRSAE